MKVLNPISDLLTGPLPSVIALGLFAGAGLYIAFSGDIKSGGKLFAQVAVGIGIALGAVQILSWLGISGAIV